MPCTAWINPGSEDSLKLVRLLHNEGFTINTSNMGSKLLEAEWVYKGVYIRYQVEAEVIVVHEGIRMPEKRDRGFSFVAQTKEEIENLLAEVGIVCDRFIELRCWRNCRAPVVPYSMPA